MQDMMQVIIPLSCERKWAPVAMANEAGCLILLVLQNQMNMTFGLMDPPRKLFQEMAASTVFDRMHSVQPQPVETKLLDPIKRVLNDELSNNLGPPASKLTAAPQ